MTVPVYPKYKDSGVDWIGPIPAGWQTEPLKVAYSVVGGATPKSEVEDYWDGGVPWVTPGDLSKLTSPFIGETMRTISEKGLASCAASKVPTGSVILSTRAPIGSLGITTEPTTTNQGCKALVPRRGANPRFLAHTLSVATEALKVRGKGTTFLELSGDELARFKVPTPSPAEQSGIVAFLDRETWKIDALLEAQRRLIELLKEKRQAVISQAVIKGLDPTGTMKESGVEWLGKVPPHWKVKRMRFLADISTGDGDTADAQEDGEFPFYVRSPTIERIGRFSHDCEAVLTSGDGAGVGKIFHHVAGKFTAHQRVYIFDRFRGVTAKFFFYYLRENFFKVALEGGAKSTVDSLRRPLIANFWMTVPPIPEQEAIVVEVERLSKRFDDLIREAEAATIVLQERRAALISAAVTGKIDVRGLVAEQAEAA